MRILILSPYLPYPLSSGGAQGVFNMVDQLRKHHQFIFLTNEGGANNRQNQAALQALWPDVKIILYPRYQLLRAPGYIFKKATRLLLRKFFPNSRKLQKEMAIHSYGECFSQHHISYVNHLIDEQQIDLVEVNFIESLHWGYHLPKHVKKVFVHHEIGFVKRQRILSQYQLTPTEQKQLDKEKRQELQALEQYDAVISMTDTDAGILRKEQLQTPIYVSSSAINTPASPYVPGQGKLTFIGGIGHQPNIEGIKWFTAEVAPLLQNHSLTLNLVGNGWANDNAQSPYINIQIHGFVPNLSSVAAGSIMIVPILSGSGMRMKILEAAAMSLPIVTTTVGVEGLDFHDGESCIVADTPQQFAEAILRLEQQPDLRKAIGMKAQEIFNQRYSPKVLTQNRDNIYHSLIS